MESPLRAAQRRRVPVHGKVATPARRTETDEYQRNQAVARELREAVGDQLHDLVIERDGLGSYDDFRGTIRRLGEIGQMIAQARGRQQQAAELGMAVSPAVQAEREALGLLRAAAMTSAGAAAGWVVAMDFDAKRAELDAQSRNGKRSRKAADDEEENI